MCARSGHTSVERQAVRLDTLSEISRAQRLEVRHPTMDCREPYSPVLTAIFPLALAGNRLGAVRDAKGKSVAQVFAGLGASQKAEVSHPLVLVVFSES